MKNRLKKRLALISVLAVAFVASGAGFLTDFLMFGKPDRAILYGPQASDPTSPTPTEGSLYWNTTDDNYKFYDGSSWSAGAVMEVDFDANSILAATLDDTPSPLTVAEDRILGRATGGNIDDLTAAQVRAILNVEDGAAADMSDAEIETAYNNQVGIVSQVDAETGTSTTAERWTPQRVKQAIDALASGAGDVSGPGSSTDHAIARFDLGTGKLLQNSTVIVTDAGNVTGLGTLNGNVIATGSNSGDVTLAGTPDYLTIAGQVITRGQIDLAADVTGELPTGNLADNAITLAKMAGGTAGNLISYDASGDPAAVATGSAGEVLTSNGAGAAPTFQAAGGGGSGGTVQGTDGNTYNIELAAHDVTTTMDAAGEYTVNLQAEIAGPEDVPVADYSAILGGSLNEVGSGAKWSVVVGGWNNQLTGTGDYQFMLGGNNDITASGSYNTIAGGGQNSITETVQYGFAAGRLNNITGNSQNSVAFGYDTDIDDANSTLAAGHSIDIFSGSDFGAAFGYGHDVHNSDYVHVSGRQNVVNDTSDFAFIHGYRGVTVAAADPEFVTIFGPQYQAHIDGTFNLSGGYNGNSNGDAPNGFWSCVQNTSGTTQEEMRFYPVGTFSVDGAFEMSISGYDFSYFLEVMIIGQSSGNEVGCYKIFYGGAERGGTATEIFAPIITEVHEDDATWTVDMDVDDTTDTIRILVQGGTGDDVNWTAKVNFVGANE